MDEIRGYSSDPAADRVRPEYEGIDRFMVVQR